MNRTSRRQAMGSAIAGASVVLSGKSAFAQQQQPRQIAGQRTVSTAWELNPAEYIEYGRSFICNEYTDQNRPAADPNNKPMFLIESRTQIIHNGATTTYYQCASCKSEDTYPPQYLFKTPNYDFLPIFGPAGTLVFRRGARFNTPLADYKRAEGQKWGTPQAALRIAPSVRMLDTAKKVFEVTRPEVALPIVARTHARADDGYEAVIEYPVKTMNATAEGGYKYQADTGPIAWPNLWRGDDRGIGCLSLAFIAFNNDSQPPAVVEIVEEQPIEVPLPDDPQRKVLVYHYERSPDGFRFPAKTTLVALEMS